MKRVLSGCLIFILLSVLFTQANRIVADLLKWYLILVVVYVMLGERPLSVMEYLRKVGRTCGKVFRFLAPETSKLVKDGWARFTKAWKRNHKAGKASL